MPFDAIMGSLAGSGLLGSAHGARTQAALAQAEGIKAAMELQGSALYGVEQLAGLESQYLNKQSAYQLLNRVDDLPLGPIGYIRTEKHNKPGEITKAEMAIKENKCSGKKELGLLTYKPVVVMKGNRFRGKSSKRRNV